ncbi:tRNA (adenosine(37)-N6)-threonylcarbamoyltransferase complex ATPase subunit type 1 TsaE [Pseudoroseicyclus aestuarii]|uniref:tRNA threonylcarbamoyladenosine biosynthesis protein TsaE n=1 Tax=Pseudoroseicyclus aestuarii TaxID=1795041 RepID=A0A318SW85_9RHOB|nr:tRNA (adenosine(37)-N6)-threonylcarbamoyltransferase complex ATPase subunit type 1 TsaE [Pseudoroseicyclus aestuarii]PYE84626.1 tRNA threonylcarbamoyladenosine biosynthesis protein TsaE [Pseudoroseicyclus aestuarii]
MFRPAPIPLPTEAATSALAARLAPRLGGGDCLLLEGPIGAGKTFFARALIRARLGDPLAEVPSPTFTLVQVYETPDLELWHADLYRLSDPSELDELGLVEAMDAALSLVEWPQKLGALLPETALTLSLHPSPEAGTGADAPRMLQISGADSWRARLEPILD